ncbi:zinc ABC transporter substrate-binding protein [Microbacterium sp. 2FI]|uniref:metal ABC transporter solute-binding protein, Zn/Mn family n=1 Tax=Microbacterium sp. 2FI TaxID=2502193 RepID=UPI0010F71A7A|nr:zinc ABC transporter substrate-binding protein [Microbacterium sp. 2FI]
MTSPRRTRTMTLLGLAAASSLALAGCASGNAAAGGADDGRIAVVASTSVYGQIAEAIGGELVEVTSIVTSDSQDPHAFEPSARDQLTVADADLIIENGGGYDSFIDALIDASGSQAPVLTAVEFSSLWEGGAAHDDSDDDDGHDHDHVEGFNEHVWYDPATMGALAHGIASKLESISPTDADSIQTGLASFLAEVETLEADLAIVDADHAGAGVFVTEPVPVYLVEAAGLDNLTPDAFSEAVEEGQDVAPATLLASLQLIEAGDVSVVITNAQTGGAETNQIVDAAETADIPVIAFTETLPEGQTYISWMQANNEALSTALNG